MSTYDDDILLQRQRDGIRTVSGQHIRTPREATENRWVCGVCQDQGCDLCNDPLDAEPGRGIDGEGDRDWKLDR